MKYIPSVDTKQKQLTNLCFVHKYFNELLKTDNIYYKNATIYPVLETIEDKLCHIMVEQDDEQV